MHPSRQQQPQHQLLQKQSSSSSAIYAISSLQLESANYKTSRQSTSPSLRLTPEEEKELLRRAVEYRRLNNLEKDLALQNLNTLPLLSVRAKAAGYGEELEAYESAKLEGQLAREQLVTHNMGLVKYCVNQIIGKETYDNKVPLNSLSREDLMQEGSIGLARAVDKWDPAIGGKFSTYAVYWVRAAVLRCIAERDDVVRVPSHISQAVVQINKAAKRLGWSLQESGGILTNESSTSLSWKAAAAAKLLAEEAGLSESRFEEAMKVRRRKYSGGYVPFESYMSTKGGQKHHSDENEDHERKRLESSVANEELRTVLSKHLRPKEVEALSWRYGLFEDEDQLQTEFESIKDRANRQLMEMEDQLFGASALTKAASAKRVTTKPAAAPVKAGRFGEAMTFTEVGKKMQVSAEYTRRLCHKALNKLKQAAEDGTLEPALLY